MKRTHSGRTTLVAAALVFFLGRIAWADPDVAGPSWPVPETLLPPWTPVTVQENAPEVRVGVWGREYRFAGAPLPTAVSTAGAEMLAGPMRLMGTADGKPITWQRGGNLVQRHDLQQAVVCGWQASETLIINTTSATEFDGMMRVGLVIAAQRASPKLQKLWLEVPLRPERAILYHYWPGRWGSAANSGALPEEGLSLAFHPFVWLGWEDGGLAWFAESDQGWQPADAGHAIEVVRQGGEMVLRVHLLDASPPRLPITFTFGFQATPVKPMPRDFHDWRICHGASYGMETRPFQKGSARSMLDRAAELGVRTLIFHESWTPIQNYWETTRDEELKKLVAACHQRGIKLLLYFGYELSTLAPEWARMSDEVLVKTPAGGFTGGYHRQPEQRDYIVCYQSRWGERLAEGIAQALDRYGFDGVYLDGTIEPFACANERHGCGYRAADGSLHPTYPIFAVRRLMQRLYALTRPRHGLVNAHQSTCCVTPTLAFCDSYWDGEQFQGGELAGDPLRHLPLAAFRAEFMGANFGVPCEFLVYEKPPNWTFDHALAFTLLHDVRVRPGGVNATLERMSPIWEVQRRFGIESAEWHPYWSNAGLVKAQPASVLVSFYLRRANGARSPGALLVISNLWATETVEARVVLDLAALGLTGDLKATDALTGEHLALRDGKLAVPVAPVRMRMVEVQADGGIPQ
jgi:hypothetical protein